MQQLLEQLVGAVRCCERTDVGPFLEHGAVEPLHLRLGAVRAAKIARPSDVEPITNAGSRSESTWLVAPPRSSRVSARRVGVVVLVRSNAIAPRGRRLSPRMVTSANRFARFTIDRPHADVSPVGLGLVTGVRPDLWLAHHYRPRQPQLAHVERRLGGCWRRSASDSEALANAFVRSRPRRCAHCVTRLAPREVESTSSKSWYDAAR